MKKPVQIDLIYHDNAEDSNTNLITTERTLSRRTRSHATTSLALPATSPTPRGNLGDQTEIPTTIMARPINDTWALGGIAATVPARGDVSLLTHTKYLGRPLSSGLDINSKGWVVAQRLKFHNSEISIQQINPFLQRFHQPKATTVPEIFKIDHNSIVGEGSMRRAYSAQIKTKSRRGGAPRITNWVAKVRYHNRFPNIKLHATDARMQDYQGVIAKSPSNLLTTALRQKAKAFNIVRHCVIFTGEETSPSEVYFLEASLPGQYVKYLSNVNFSVTSRQPGMDIDNLSIMNGFTHWSYVASRGNTLVCDLQGVGSTITDPQIVDRNHVLWGDGNNATRGIQQFLENHICNDVCRALKLGSPKDIIPEVANSTQLRTSAEINHGNTRSVATDWPAITTNPRQNWVAIASLLSTNVNTPILPNLDYFQSDLNLPTADRTPVNTSGR
ncbi:hypothetical protein PCANC_11322 [Puccinia coronata f. sp. avenae]|uniref:Alpha-type protein kinase domain-containing protein n=1 Tax=Puccinia coronata f. sp. avenae TaxID=200324 RepID=A0A2N5VT64_9BASI|nr:hypothetical protein PCANC_11322 [Puccinia coronata f. sp. avenae]